MDRVNELLDILDELGVTEHTIYQHLLNFFPADDLAEALEDLRIEITDELDDVVY